MQQSFNRVRLSCHRAQVHQLKRLGTPTFLVTTHEAQNYPRVWVRTARLSHSRSPGRLPQLTHNERAHFDRVLCDVPCTGDGQCAVFQQPTRPLGD